MEAVCEIADEQIISKRADRLRMLGDVCSQWSKWHNCPVEALRAAVCRCEWSPFLGVSQEEYTKWTGKPRNLRVMAVVMYLCIRTIEPTFGHCATDMFRAFRPCLFGGNLVPGSEFSGPPEDGCLFSDVVTAAAFIPETRWWFASAIRRLEGGQDLLDHMTRAHGLVFPSSKEIQEAAKQGRAPVLKRRREDDDPEDEPAPPPAKAQRTE
jgi:hypothetical protein